MASANLDLFNQIAVASGGAGGHEFNIDALNEIASQLIGEPQSFTYNLDALNAIAENISGEPQSFTLIIDALNFISGELSGDADTDTTSVGALTEWAENAASAYRDIVQADNPIHYWPMDEASGTSLAPTVGATAITVTGATVGVAGHIDGTAVQFDGVNDFAKSASAINLSAYGKLVVECLLYWDGYADDNDVAIEFTASGASTAGGFFLIPNGASPWTGKLALASRGNVALNSASYDRPFAAAWHHVAMVVDYSQAGTAELQLYIDGVLATASSRPHTTDNAGVFANDFLNLFARNGGSLFGAGKMQHLAIYSDLSSDRIAAHASSAGVVVDYDAIAFANADLWDNGYSSTPAASPFSRLSFTTSARYIRVTATTDSHSVFPAWAHIGVLVDGVAVSPVALTANGLASKVADLGSDGTLKTVELVNGLQTRPVAANPVLGTYITGLEVDSEYGATLQTPTIGDRVLVYGDSISVGASATNPETQGWAPLLRTAHARRVMVEGWGYRSLHEDGVDATARQAFADRVAGYTPATIWLAIGTNDYGLNKWTAAAFGTAYADLLDKLHAALPSAAIYCQTPLVRTTETANGAGSTLPEYRTAIADACTARAWSTLVDGTAILTTAELDDGVHPTTAGHAAYAAYVDGVLP